MDRNYLPISCDAYDALLSLATLRKASEVDVVSSAGQVERLRGVVADVYTSNGAEYLRLKDGHDIRLDRIQALNGRAFK